MSHAKRYNPTMIILDDLYAGNYVGVMDKDKVIDLLHAIMCQYEGNTVTLDGGSFFIEEICKHAIQYIEKDDGDMI